MHWLFKSILKATVKMKDGSVVHCWGKNQKPWLALSILPAVCHRQHDLFALLLLLGCFIGQGAACIAPGALLAAGAARRRSLPAPLQKGLAD